MPLLRTNYQRQWIAARPANKIGGTTGAAGRSYIGPVEVSLNVMCDGSGVAVVSAHTVISMLNAWQCIGWTSTSGYKLVILAVKPLVFSGQSAADYLLEVTSLSTGGSIAYFRPEINGTIVTTSLSAYARVVAVICSGPFV